MSKTTSPCPIPSDSETSHTVPCECATVGQHWERKGAALRQLFGEDGNATLTVLFLGSVFALLAVVLPLLTTAAAALRASGVAS